MTNTLWVHGNAAQIQDPSRVTAISYGGPGLTGTFAVGGAAWVHVPLPTPTMLGTEEAELVSVHLKLALGEVEIDNLVIYDGPTPIYSTSAGGTSYVLPKPVTIKYGVGVSMHLVLPHGPDDNNPQPQSIVINAVGGEYTYPVVFTAVKSNSAASTTAAVNAAAVKNN